MADVNKSVEISYRADLKQLIGQLKKMPGITEAEAKKMVAQLDRQFKKAERSAKKASSKQAKAMQGVSNSANKASLSVQNLGNQTKGLNKAFAGAGQAATMLSPELGEMLSIGAGLTGAFESLTKGLKNLNPAWLVLGAAVGAAAVAYGILNDKNEKHLDLLTRTREAEEAERQRLAGLASTIGNVSDRYEKAARALAVFTGQTTALDAEILAKKNEINKATQNDVDAMSERIRQNERLVEILNREASVFGQMTDEEKELVKAAQMRFETVNKTVDISAALIDGGKAARARNALERELSKEIDEQKNIRDAIIIRGEQTVEMTEELIRLQDEYNEEQKEEEERLKRIKKSKDEINALQKAITSALEQALDPIEKMELSYQKQIDFLVSQAHLIKSNHKLETKFQQALETLEKNQAAEAAQAVIQLDDIEKSIEQRRVEALTNLRKQQEKAHKARMDELLAEKNQQIQAAQTISGAFDQFAKSSFEFINSTGKASEEQLEKAFRMQQLAGIAQATINGAVAATRALADLGPIAGPIAVGAISAATVAQIAVISQQKPPTSHMGGYLQPDEQVRTVLTGEAVLDRATVNRIGGESGVRSLMNDGATSSDSVVVLQPFRHIDRYNKSARMMQGRKASRRY